MERKIPVAHPIHDWLMRHTSFLQNILVKGDDGFTPWARIRGRPFGKQLLGFAGFVWYKFAEKGPRRDGCQVGRHHTFLHAATFLGAIHLQHRSSER